MKQILRDNALEAWAMAIKNCNAIIEGKVTLGYRKQFVTSLHNAVELLIKQHMLNVNDYRVAEVKKEVLSDGQPAKDFYNSLNLNMYFANLDNKTMKKFYSVEFQKLKDIGKELFNEYLDKDKNQNFCDGMKLLADLRNNETHFFIDKNGFLGESEFENLYNFMIIFYGILDTYKLLPYWGTCHKDSEHWKLFFRRKELNNFSYKKVLKNAEFVKELKGNIENEIFPSNCGSDAYGISYSISCVCNQYCDEKFEELWTYIEMLLYFKILKYQDDGEEIEYDNEEGDTCTGYNSWRQYYINL